ncbi:TetR/AcrR family transcriptional regulator [Pelagibacterium halotolerans]|uniref:TetR/AcrR family transcriptional regulator n=1 Tax=Pelagibacterium halotolerans TaxID=531813 RepID=UPI00384AA664
MTPMALTIGDETLSDRQKDVLNAALSLLVEGGDGLTMTGVARRASCSKETLYKWFGDRDGLLTATVQWQAAKVRMVPVDRETLDKRTLAIALEKFGRNLLSVLAGDVSVALNRLAISHAGQEKRNLGAIVLENGRFAMGKRLKPVLEAGRDAGLLAFEDSETAFRTYYGLVVRDVQLRLLLGEHLDLGETEIASDVKRAREQFFTLYGA